MWSLANPTRFMTLTGGLLPWVAGLAALLLGLGLYMGWFLAPADYQQGETVRIMFLHVPAAWLALFFYVVMAISAPGTLVRRHPLADVSQKAAAPSGAAFTLICLVTGALWGKPMWGTIEERSRAARAVSILTLIGVVNLPVIKFSVDWWYTLHQGASVLRLGGPSIHPSILYPLLVMAAGFTLLGLALHLAGMRTEILRRR